jgi:hypothetical protein
LIGKIREYEKTGLLLDKSVESAVKYCLENNILKDFLREYAPYSARVCVWIKNLARCGAQ